MAPHASGPESWLHKRLARKKRSRDDGAGFNFYLAMVILFLLPFEGFGRINVQVSCRQVEPARWTLSSWSSVHVDSAVVVL